LSTERSTGALLVEAGNTPRQANSRCSSLLGQKWRRGSRGRWGIKYAGAKVSQGIKELHGQANSVRREISSDKRRKVGKQISSRRRTMSADSRGSRKSVIKHPSSKEERRLGLVKRTRRVQSRKLHSRRGRESGAHTCKTPVDKVLQREPPNHGCPVK